MKLLRNFLLMIFLLAMVPSCADYLDVVPDNTITLEDLFKSQEEAWDALAKVYSYMPRIDATHSSMWTLGDEFLGRLDLNDGTGNLRGIRIMRGLQSPTSPVLGTWSGTGDGKRYYTAIRQANVFLSLIDSAGYD